MSKYAIEALLRPVVEIHSAMLAFVCAYVCYFFGEYILLPPTITQGMIVFFVSYGLWRFFQARKLWSYQKSLKVLPKFEIALSKIPYSAKAVYMGIGFLWKAKHTQRCRDCRLPENEPYLADSKLYAWARLFALANERGILAPVAKLLNSHSRLNPFRPKPPVGGEPYLHGVGMLEGERPIWEDRSENVGHHIVIGTTRVGKTRLAELLITQDIQNGETVFVFDPKGDADLLETIYAAAQAAGRSNDLYVFHLAYPEISARYNPIGTYTRITEVATRIANALPGSGNSAAFKEFGWRFTNIIAQALHFLGRRVSYESIAKHIDDVDQLIIEYGESWMEQQWPGQWQAEVAREKYGLTGSKDDTNKPSVATRNNAERSHDDNAVCVARILTRLMKENSVTNPVADGLLSAFKFEKTYFDKIVASLGPFLAKLTTGQVSELLSPNYDDINDSRPIFDPLKVIRTNGIVYIGLAALQDATVASAVGNAMFSDITATAGQLYAYGSKLHKSMDDYGYNKIAIHADEFNELIGDEFIPLLNKAGGAGVQVTAYTQTVADIQARLGDVSKAEQVLGNLNKITMMRVLKPETAQLLTDRLPTVQVNHVTVVSGATQSSNPTSPADFTSRSEDRVTTTEVPMLEPNDLTALPKGQAFILTEGSKLTKVRLPLSKKDKSIKIPKGIASLTQHMRVDMREHYSDTWSKDEWWQSNILNEAAA